jgi:hypothetical protein
MVERCCTLAQRFARNLGMVRGIHVLNDVVLNQVLVAFDSPDHDHDSLADETGGTGPKGWRLLVVRDHLARTPRDAHLRMQLEHKRR